MKLKRGDLVRYNKTCSYTDRRDWIGIVLGVATKTKSLPFYSGLHYQVQWWKIKNIDPSWDGDTDPSISVDPASWLSKAQTRRKSS